MKVTIDTEAKTISVHEKVSIQALMDFFGDIINGYEIIPSHELKIPPLYIPTEPKAPFVPGTPYIPPLPGTADPYPCPPNITYGSQTDHKWPFPEQAKTATT